MVIIALPKEYTIFRFQIPFVGGSVSQHVKHDAEATNTAQSEAQSAEPTEKKEAIPEALVFELHGEQFKNRAAPDRAKKQFKMHLPPDL